MNWFWHNFVVQNAIEIKLLKPYETSFAILDDHTNTNVKQDINYNKKAINTNDDNSNSNKPVKVKRLVYYL